MLSQMMKLSHTQWLQSMSELSRTQDEEVGDATTSIIILGMFLVGDILGMWIKMWLQRCLFSFMRTM